MIPMKRLMTRVAAVLLLLLGTAQCVTELTAADFAKVTDGSKHVLVEFYAPWCGHCQSLEPIYRSLATAYSKVTNTVIAKIDGEKYKEIAAKFEVKGFPTIKYFPLGSDEPSDVYSGERTTEGLVEYLNTHTGNDVQLPKAPDLVVAVTDENFGEIVDDPTKHVMLEFYAPWCGHCKRLAPEYEVVAASFDKEDSVVVAKIDADKFTATAVKHGVTGYPTLKWFSKTDKSGEVYTGGRSPAAIVSFINERAGTLWDVGGRLLPQAGTVAALDEFVLAFATQVEQRDQVLAKVEAAVAALSGEDAVSGQYYLKVMHKLASDSSFALREHDRLARLTQAIRLFSRITPQGPLSSKKAVNFYRRINVLALFVRAARPSQQS